jgi:hypothetical protein
MSATTPEAVRHVAQWNEHDEERFLKLFNSVIPKAIERCHVIGGRGCVYPSSADGGWSDRQYRHRMVETMDRRIHSASERREAAC